MSQHRTHEAAMMNEAQQPTRSPLEGEPNRPMRFGGGRSPRHTLCAQHLRKAMTPWECQLWRQLKGKRLGGYKFRRQQPMGHYIVDFVNMEKRVVVELDGSQHVDSVYDRQRDAYLMAQGYSVLRFWNTDVNANPSGVLEAILSVLEAPPHQTTSHRSFVSRISSFAWEVVWLPLKGGAGSGDNVPYTSIATASRHEACSKAAVEQSLDAASSPIEGEPEPDRVLVGGGV